VRYRDQCLVLFDIGKLIITVCSADVYSVPILNMPQLMTRFRVFFSYLPDWYVPLRPYLRSALNEYCAGYSQLPLGTFRLVNFTSCSVSNIIFSRVAAFMLDRVDGFRRDFSLTDIT